MKYFLILVKQKLFRITIWSQGFNPHGKLKITKKYNSSAQGKKSHYEKFKENDATFAEG